MLVFPLSPVGSPISVISASVTFVKVDLDTFPLSRDSGDHEWRLTNAFKSSMLLILDREIREETKSLTTANFTPTKSMETSVSSLLSSE